MRIETVEWTKSQPLAEDYLHNYSKISSLYELSPWEARSWEQRAEWLGAGKDAPRAGRSALADALLQFNERAGNKPAALEAIGEPRRRGVPAGGGPPTGRFGGPLLVR